MTYAEWAKEYLDSAAQIKENMTVIKQQLPTAPVSELKDMNFRISVLYQMYLDCLSTANILKKRKGVAF